MPDTLRICLITTLILGIASTAPAQEKKNDKKSVSYTHLTLPTILLV